MLKIEPQKPNTTTIITCFMYLLYFLPKCKCSNLEGQVLLSWIFVKSIFDWPHMDSNPCHTPGNLRALPRRYWTPIDNRLITALKLKSKTAWVYLKLPQKCVSYVITADWYHAIEDFDISRNAMTSYVASVQTFIGLLYYLWKQITNNCCLRYIKLLQRQQICYEWHAM